jgi:uncharacterized protein (DUF4415 family)
MPTLRSPSGTVIDLPDEQSGSAIASGYTPLSDQEAGQIAGAPAKIDNGIVGSINAGATSLLSGLTVGLSDVGLAALSDERTRKNIAADRANNPGISAAGQFTGALLPAVLTGGESAAAEGIGSRILANTPAGMTSSLGHAVTSGLAREGAGVLERAGVGALGAAAEGSLYGGGDYLSQVALEDKPLAAEGFVGAMGKGALFGGAVGGTLSLGESALIRARSLFPKSEITAAHASGIHQDAVSAVEQAVSDGDAMAAAAKQKLDLTEAKIGVAEGGENITRRMFGGADPESMADQVVGGADRAEIQGALKRYDAAKAQMDDWIRTEIDPDLEAAMGTLKPPGVQRPGAVKYEPTEATLQGWFPETPDTIHDAMHAADREMAGYRDPNAPASLGEPVPQAPPGKTSIFNMDSSGLGFDPNSNTYHGEPRVEPRTPEALLNEVRGMHDEMRAADAKHAQPKPQAEPMDDAEYRSYLAEHSARVDPDVAEAFRAQSDNGLFAHINAPLRESGDLEKLPKHLKEIAEKLDRGIAQSPAPRDMTLFRGVTGKRSTNQWLPTEIGDSIVDHGFGSTSVDPKVGSSYAKGMDVRQGVELVLNIPKGYPASPVPGSEFAKESELMLPRNTKYTVTKIDTGGNGRKIIHVDVSHAAPGETSSVAELNNAPRVPPLEEMNLKQIDKYRDILGNEEDHALKYSGNRSPEYKEAKEKSNQAYSRRSAIKEGRVPEPAGAEWNEAPAEYVKTDRPAGGSQGGSWYKDKDGQQWFGKQYKGDYDRLSGENLSDRLYRTFGVDAPETKVAWINGKRTLLSKEIEGKIAETAADVAHTNIKDGFVVDAWLGNHDVLGQSMDNILVKDGKAYRIDNGGSMIWKATGGEKEFKHFVSELESMRDPKRSAGRAFSGITQEEIDAQLRRFADSYRANKKIVDDLIDDARFGDGDTERIKAAIHARAEDLIAKAPKVEIPAATDTLTGLLRGTKSKLDAGTSLRDMGAPSVADYVTAKAEKTAAAAEHFRAKANEANYSGSKMALDEAAAKTHPVEIPSQSIPVMMTNKMKAQLDELGYTRAEISEMRPAEAWGKINAGPREAGVRGPEDLRALIEGMGGPQKTSVLGKRTLADEAIGIPVSSAEYSTRQSLGKRILNNEGSPISDILKARDGKNVDAGPSIARAAKAIDGFERANADLVDVLGDKAPPTAKANAKAYREAAQKQAASQGASTAKMAGDLGDKLAPAVKGNAGKAMGILADAATAMEVLHALGVHTPDVSAIPVIGPVLSLFLKARAAMKILGRKGGSIGKTADGVIASKAAQTRERITKATAELLETGARGAKKAAVMAGPSALLASKLFPGDGDTKSKDPRVLFDARSNEISRAMQPGAVEHAIGDRMQTPNAEMQDAIIAQTRKGIAFLDSKRPKQTMLPGMLPGDGTWKPSMAAINEFAKYVHAVNDPASVIEDLAKGHLSLEGAETLRTVYPNLFAEAQKTLLSHAATFQKTLPYARRVALSIMYQVPVDGTMTPSHMNFLNPPPAAAATAVAGGAMGGGAPQAGPAILGQLQIGQQTMPATDRRASQ